MRKYYVLILATLFFFSCQRGVGFISDSSSSDSSGSPGNTDNRQNKLIPSQYVSWVENKDNGLEKKKKIDDITYVAQYRPVPYIICQEERKDDIADSLVKRRSGELNGMQYLNLKIEVPQGELLKYKITSRAEYDERVNYFSFGMQKDIQLVDGKDTLPCVLFHYERIYDVAPYGIFLMAFPKGKSTGADKTLIFSDNQFNKGIIKFHFDSKNIENVPQLQTI